MESSRIRDQTLDSCIGRRILYHWITAEALHLLLNLTEIKLFILRTHILLSMSSQPAISPCKHRTTLQWYAAAANYKGKHHHSVVTDCNPMDCSPPGSSVHGILQASILEWVARLSSRGVFPIQGSNLGLPPCRRTHSKLLLEFIPWSVLEEALYLQKSLRKKPSVLPTSSLSPPQRGLEWLTKSVRLRKKPSKLSQSLPLLCE